MARYPTKRVPDQKVYPAILEGFEEPWQFHHCNPIDVLYDSSEILCTRCGTTWYPTTVRKRKIDEEGNEYFEEFPVLRMEPRRPKP